MSNPNLKLSLKILSQDLAYCIDSYNENRFNEMNVGANRFLENSVFLNDNNLYLVGVFLKEIANDYIYLTTKKSKNFPLDSAKVIGKNFLSTLKDNFNNDLNKDSLWKKFHNYEISIGKYQKDSLESVSYHKNPNFTKKSFDYLFSWLDENRDFLLYEHNNIIDTIINAMVRIIKNHSCSKEELICYIYFKVFGLLYPYLYFDYFTNKKLNEDSMRNLCFPLIDEIINFRKNKQEFFSKLDETLWNMVKSWRDYYFKYKNSPFISLKTLEIPKQVIINIIEEYFLEKKKLNNYE